MKKLKQLRAYAKLHWRMILAITAGTAVVCLLMLARLGSLSGGLSDSEVKQQLFASSWHHIAKNPLYAPLTVVEWLLLTIIPHHGVTVTRLASPLFGVAAAACFAYVLRRWYGVRTAVYGTVIFSSSSWFLHVSRFAGPDVLYLWAIPMLLATHIAWERHIKKQASTFLAFTVFAVLLYIPGMIWLIVVSLALQSHHLLAGWHSLARWQQRVAACALFLVLLIPLAVALISDASLVSTWLGLPKTFNSAGEIPRNLMHSISFFFYRGPANPQLWLDRLPLLSFFSMVMAVLGSLFYAKHASAPRTRLLATLYIIGALFFALSGPVTISVLVPVVYLIVTAGVGYLLHEWLRVFPRNPLARSIGFTLLALAITLVCTYNLRSYFVAWPHNPATRATFRNHP